MADSIPEYIKLGSYEVHYKDINDYQKSIYEMLSFYVQILNQVAVDVDDVKDEQKEYLRTAGVVRFLKNRLQEFGDLEKVPRNLYDNWEAQLKLITDTETWDIDDDPPN